MKKKIYIPKPATIITTLACMLVPVSYESFMLSIPSKLVGVVTEDASATREFYKENEKHYKYDNLTSELLSNVIGSLDFNGYSECGKFLDSNFINIHAHEKLLDSPCILPRGLMSYDPVPKKQGVRFFYGCMIDGGAPSDCLEKYN